MRVLLVCQPEGASPRAGPSGLWGAILHLIVGRDRVAGRSWSRGRGRRGFGRVGIDRPLVSARLARQNGTPRTRAVLSDALDASRHLLACAAELLVAVLRAVPVLVALGPEAADPAAVAAVSALVPMRPR